MPAGPQALARVLLKNQSYGGSEFMVYDQKCKALRSIVIQRLTNAVTADGTKGAPLEQKRKLMVIEAGSIGTIMKKNKKRDERLGVRRLGHGFLYFSIVSAVN